MKNIENEVRVGIKDKDTHELIKIYPYRVMGDFDKITDTVMTWYYRQGCINGESMKNYFVDVLDDK